MLQKEDSQLAYDVEIFTKSEQGYDVTNDINMYDTPLEVYKLCFPNDRTPKASLTNIYRDVFSAYLSKKNKLSIQEIENIVTTSKKGMGKLEMDICVKTVIEGEFQAILEAETHISMEIIYSTPVSELHNTKTMSEKLTIVNAEPQELSDYTVFKNKLIRGT
jgi:hypothetical protein